MGPRRAPEHSRQVPLGNITNEIMPFLASCPCNKIPKRGGVILKEDFFLSVVQETTEKLQEHGCVSIDKTEGTDSFVRTTPLGRAASNFYLCHETPKEMQTGLRELRKVLAQHAPELKSGKALPKQKFVTGGAESGKRVQSKKKR